jgi:uncharacterized protein
MSNAAKNPFTWVEIYVEDMERAKNFYESILQIKMIPMETPGGDDGLEMLSFPFEEGGPNISGALCKFSEIKPAAGGAVVYFSCEDCAVEASRVETAGGKLIQNKFSIGDFGFCALIMDTEGNIVGLHSMN